MRARSLRARLFASYAAVAASGAAALLASVRLLVPRLFDARTSGAGRGAGNADGASQHGAVVSALNVALVVALAVSLVVGSIVAVLVARRLLRPIDDLRAATRRIAAGRYDRPVVPPEEPELSALADDVNHLATVLADTERRRAALVGDVAHEMRTPLATITGYLEGFGDGLFTTEELTATVSAEVDRLHRLARDLSEASRTDEGRLLLEIDDVDLGDVAAAAVARLRAPFAERGVDVTVLAPDPVPVRADRERIVQAITNLVGNALAYTPAGGAVAVDVTCRDGVARVAVTDTGRGLAPEQLPHVFERFYRADRHDRTGGTGIGLTIARAIARAHDGDLTAASPGVGRGATFELTLPARR